MHAGKRWTHAATRPMRHNPKSPKSQIGEWDSGELEARPIQNDAPNEKRDLKVLHALTGVALLLPKCCIATLITRRWVAVPIFASSQGGRVLS